MITITFARIYPENTGENKIIVDKATFTDPNRANQFALYEKKKAERLKISYFIGIEEGEATRCYFQLYPQEIKIIKEFGRADIKKFEEHLPQSN